MRLDDDGAMTEVALTEEEEPTFVVERGSIIAYRAFDTCDVAVLLEAERLLLQSRMARNSIQFRKPPSRELGALRQPAAPLGIDLGFRDVTLSSGEVTCHVSAHLFDYGTISVSFEVPVRASTNLDDVVRTATALSESNALSELAHTEFDELADKIGAALRGRHALSETHSYVVVQIARLGAATTIPQLLAWPDLPKLVACEGDARRVSEQQQDDVLKYTDSYLHDDVVVIGDACALVIEPSGARDVADVLELIRAQMAQLLHYDDVLDVELEAAYRDFDRGMLSLAFYSPFGSTLRRLSRRRLELTEFTERIDGALKVLSDAYLARVYRKAMDRFAVHDVKNRVAHKHRLLLDIYTALKDEVALVRSFTVELLIVVLIVTEVVLAIID